LTIATGMYANAVSIRQAFVMVQVLIVFEWVVG